MSETLTSQELTALKEMPLSPEMGELRKITTLQDIPLAEGDSMQQHDFQNSTNIETESKLKTNSLKRFFRLPMKKKTEQEGCLEGATSHIEFEEGFKVNSIQQNPTQMDLIHSSLEYKRFKLAYGHYESNPNNVAGNTKQITASVSKANLKSSLSSYWNSVFKQKKSRKFSKTQKELEQAATSSAEMENSITNYAKNPSANEVSGNNDNDPKNSSVLEEIHNLTISEESQTK